MKLGFLLFEYFPFGGLQRDCLRTALTCAHRGHQVSVLCRTWQGDQPSDLAIHAVGRKGWTNVARNRNWLKAVQSILPEYRLDAVVGFNKMPGLDVYFGADPCYVNKVATSKPLWYRWLPRFQHYARLEHAVFGRGHHTRILQLTPHEIPIYQRLYGTEDRFHLLPPMAPRHSYSDTERNQRRAMFRQEYRWNAQELLLLFVGSDFRRKGLDRLLHGMAELPAALKAQTRLVVLGQCKPGRFARLAGRLGLRDRVHFMGGRSDAPHWMLASDLLVHPAYVETAGAVLVEALTLGLPVLTTGACGYAFHIEQSEAGTVMPEPFSSKAFCDALQRLLASSELRTRLRQKALDYAATENLYGCHTKAADIIEATAQGQFRND